MTHTHYTPPYHTALQLTGSGNCLVPAHGCSWTLPYRGYLTYLHLSLLPLAYTPHTHTYYAFIPVPHYAFLSLPARACCAGALCLQHHLPRLRIMPACPPALPPTCHIPRCLCFYLPFRACTLPPLPPLPSRTAARWVGSPFVVSRPVRIYRYGWFNEQNKHGGPSVFPTMTPTYFTCRVTTYRYGLGSVALTALVLYRFDRLRRFTVYLVAYISGARTLNIRAIPASRATLP